MSTEQNKAVVRRLITEALNGGNTALIDELLAPNYVNPVSGGDRASVKAMFTGMKAAIPDNRIEIENLVAEGDAVVARFTMVGTHTGSMMGESPTGKTFSVRGLTYYRFVDGRVVEDEVFTTPDLMQTLGIQMPQASR
jgi:steroid delta-isomerase-like uncharacterized protein